MTNDAEVYMQKIKARNFVQNNGQILRTINILHVNYEKLSDVKFAISNVSDMTSCHLLITSFCRSTSCSVISKQKSLPTSQMCRMKNLRQNSHQRALSSSKAPSPITRLRFSYGQKQPQSLRKNRQTAL